MSRRWYLVSGMILSAFVGLIAGAEGWSAVPVAIAGIWAIWSDKQAAEVSRETVEQRRRMREAYLDSDR